MACDDKYFFWNAGVADVFMEDTEPNPQQALTELEKAKNHLKVIRDSADEQDKDKFYARQLVASFNFKVILGKLCGNGTIKGIFWDLGCSDVSGEYCVNNIVGT